MNQSRRLITSSYCFKSEGAERETVTLLTILAQEIFGTHHPKMMILFRHDDTAQIIIHTANMIDSVSITAKDVSLLSKGWALVHKTLLLSAC